MQTTNAQRRPRSSGFHLAGAGTPTTIPFMILPDEPSPPMRYGILGSDESTDEEKLAKYTGVVTWGYLRPHSERDALWFVDPSLALETVGAAIAANDAARVDNWLKSGDLVKLGELHATQWNDDPAKEFEALVVSPFVLCRPVA